jgi:hypothetical protein
MEGQALHDLFAVSAIGHAAEWSVYDAGRLIVVVIYLHLAGASALLLSGFWSLVAERFDPAGARASYGRIAAAGTFGGVIGSLAAERIATIRLIEPSSSSSQPSVRRRVQNLRDAIAIDILPPEQNWRNDEWQIDRLTTTLPCPIV